jgi:hypothetical protein
VEGMKWKVGIKTQKTGIGTKETGNKKDWEQMPSLEKKLFPAGFSEDWGCLTNYWKGTLFASIRGACDTCWACWPYNIP